MQVRPCRMGDDWVPSGCGNAKYDMNHDTKTKSIGLYYSILHKDVEQISPITVMLRKTLTDVSGQKINHLTRRFFRPRRDSHRVSVAAAD